MTTKIDSLAKTAIREWMTVREFNKIVNNQIYTATWTTNEAEIVFSRVMPWVNSRFEGNSAVASYTNSLVKKYMRDTDKVEKNRKLVDLSNLLDF